jgi:hypothetical protein
VDSKPVSDRAHPADYLQVEGVVWRPDRRLTGGAGLIVILLLRINPAARGTSPIGVRMSPTRAPTTVGTFTRNAVAPVPIAPMIPPVVAMPTVSAALGHQLDGWRAAKLDLGRD